MKKIMFSRLFLGLSLFLAVFASAGQVQATLGESFDSAASDQKAISSVRKTAKTSTEYTVQEVRTETMTVREYASPSGIVFGIAWNGLTHPDLTPLLGSYADEYQKATKKTQRQPGRRHSQVKTGGVVVEKWGDTARDERR
jgi:hypothetical protein